MELLGLRAYTPKMKTRSMRRIVEKFVKTEKKVLVMIKFILAFRELWTY